MNNLLYVPKSEFDRALNLFKDPNVRCAVFAALCRINALYMIARAGSGHVGSTFSCLDMVSWLYLEELERHKSGEIVDICFSSKGHDVPAFYSVLIGLGMLPFEKIETLRRLGGLPGHPDVSVDHIVANSGSLGMGISKAKGMIQAHRLNGQNRRVYVMTGDGELQEGQIWESLRGAVNAHMGELTVIVDHNKIQSDHWVTATNDLGDLEARFNSCAWHVQRCDGHNLEAFGKCLQECKRREAPSIIIADTVKGSGVSFMEPHGLGSKERYRYHSGSPSIEEYNAAVAEIEETANRYFDASNTARLRLEEAPRVSRKSEGVYEQLIPAYEEALTAAGKKNQQLVVLDADLALDCGLDAFRQAFPARYVECGIAEMDMVGQAGGLALTGKLPIVHSFGAFLTPRANEQIYVNATEETKIIYVGSLCGLLPAGPGHSHQSVRDIALMSCIPGLVAFEPSSCAETVAAINWMISDAEGPCYLRLTTIPVELSFKPQAIDTLKPGCGVILREGGDGILFGYGPVMLSEAFTAAEIVSKKSDFELCVVNLPWLNHIDLNWLAATVGNQKLIFTIDNHYLSGGQGEKIASALLDLNLKNPLHLKRFGLTEFPECGTNVEVLRYHGLDSSQLAEQILMQMRTTAPS